MTFTLHSFQSLDTSQCIKAQVYLLLMKNKVFVLAGITFWLPNFIRLSAQRSAFTDHHRTSFHQLPVTGTWHQMKSESCNVLSSRRRFSEASRARGGVVFTCKAACLRLRFHNPALCVQIWMRLPQRCNKKIRLQSEMIWEQLGATSACCQLWF